MEVWQRHADLKGLQNLTTKTSHMLKEHENRLFAANLRQKIAKSGLIMKSEK